MEKYHEKELGDYQTPLYFTQTICKYLKEDLKISPEIIIEPTCGIGNFLKSASEFFNCQELIGLDINKNRLKQVDSSIPNLKLIHDNIFTFKFNADNDKSYLILGNPPWITNSELSRINSNNLPEKSNFKNEMAIDAMTGDSNFDISEAIIRKIINEFKNTESTIAFLCKTIVSRNIFKELITSNTPYSFVKQLNFNSFKVFKIDVDACLFIIQFGGTRLRDKKCEVADISNPDNILYSFGFIDDKFYSNIKDIPDIDGECQFEWRQGVKHDCASIMELECENNQLRNKNNEIVSIEHSLIYPLLKSSHLKKPVINYTPLYVIIPQQKIKQNTCYIKSEAPKTWKYLNDNKQYFEKRKSSIYKNAPDFSIFGIGDYSFRKYKVAISGFYKKPRFSLVYGDKTFMLDDTCYFLSFDDYDSAYITMLILNSDLVNKFLKNIAFLDSKRPYSKKVLKRIDLKKCIELLTVDDLKEIEKKLELKEHVSLDKYRKYMLEVN